MKEFFNSLFSQDGKISSKRFIALWAMALYTALVICSLTGISINSEIFYGTLGLIVSALGLTTISKSSLS